MKKILILTLVIFAIVLALVSCDGKEQGIITTTTTTQQITPEPPVHEHLYNEFVTAPTCTEQGYTTYTCDCGDSYVDDYFDALGHNKSDWIFDIGATSTTEGSKHTECTVCGEIINTEVIEKLIPSEGLEFELNIDGQSYYVKSIGTCTDTDIVIPDTYKGLPVTSIGERAFDNCISLTSVALGNFVTYIDDWAFRRCFSLTSVTIPDSVTSIGDDAFYECSALTSVTIPNSVTSIGERAFCECTSLTNITIPNSVASIGERAFAFCDELTSITVDENNEYYKSIDGNLYTKDEKTLIQYAIGNEATSFTIPNSVTSIGHYAFYNCTSLTSITIPDSVTNIGQYAFEGCTSLTNVTIGNSVTNIGQYAFEGCTLLQYNEYDNGLYLGNKNNPYMTLIKAKNQSITNCEIHSTTKVIYYSAFYGCTSLTSVTIGNSVTNIGDDAFTYCKSLKSVIIPNSVTSIGDDAFYGCASLTSVTIPDSVMNIGDDAFAVCSLLQYNEYDNGLYLGNENNPYVVLIKPKHKYITSCDIHSATKVIYYRAFYGCTVLTDVTIPNSVASIGGWAFCDCTSLTNVTIGNSVTSIGISAFYGCTSLTNVTIPNSVTSIGVNAFYECTALTSVTVDENNEYYKSIDGNLYTKDEKTLIQYAIGNEATSFTIPNSVTSIGKYAFYYCTSLTSVTIPDSVTSIGQSAFKNCASLTIYCEAESEPIGWSYSWNFSNCPVVWDYKNK